ncbi:hypothetical protein KDL45_01400 [bacterium]|nr:hypothetical protein [bacterium]MCB9476590.1 hypothetical protein [Deltaproteobacteria bacterium]
MMRRLILVGLLGAVIALAGPTGVRAEGVAVRSTNHAALRAEYDDNVKKLVRDPDADFLARVFFDTNWDIFLNPTNVFTAAYTLGAKKYAEIDDEDTLINQLMLRYYNADIGNTYLGGDANFKLRNVRDEQEDYNKLILRAFAGHDFNAGVNAEANASYTRFDFATSDFYDYWTQGFGVQLRKTFSHRLATGASYAMEDKNYPVLAFEQIPGADGQLFLQRKDELRQDLLTELGMFVTSNYYLLVNFAYTLQINNSNSYGDTYYNHRLRLGLSKALTDDLNVHLFAVANFRDSYEEVLIPHSYSVEEDDENNNQLIAKLNRRITGDWWFELRYARYWSTYSNRQFNFTKNIYSVGVSTSF